MAGPLQHSPADILAQLLIDRGQGSDPLTGTVWQVFVGNVPNIPDSIITVTDTSGRVDGRTMPDGEVQEHHGAQIRIRSSSPKDGYQKGRSLLIDLEKVNQERVVIDSISYIIYCVSRSGDMMVLGKDAPTSKRNLFTLNVLMPIRQI